MAAGYLVGGPERVYHTSGNYAGEEKLKHAVERLLDNADAILHLLDFTKLKTDAEVRGMVGVAHCGPRMCLPRHSTSKHVFVRLLSQLHVLLASQPASNQ